MHAASLLAGGKHAACGNDARPDQIVSDSKATCWECRSIID